MRFSEHMTGIEPSDIRKWTSIIEAKNGVNLAQGHCFIEPLNSLETLAVKVREAIEEGAKKSGYNTYCHSSGITELREAIAQKSLEFNNIKADIGLTDGDIVVTSGATGGMSCALDALIDPGDEVILFEPFYNYHVKAIQMRMGVPKFVALDKKDWTFDKEQLEEAFSPKVKAIIINTPCNPIGKVFTTDELETILAFCVEKDIVIISDEVYEFITFDGCKHVSIASLPDAKERTVTINSFSKTLAITGWRVGYTIAPKELARRIRIANEMNYACAPTPLQHAIAHVCRDWRVFLDLKDIFAAKRDRLIDGLTKANFAITIPQGASYILADVSALGYPNSVEANIGIIEKKGIAGVPGSAFFHEDDANQLIRFCFSQRSDLLEKACKALL
jgi:aminotransferase